MGETMIQDDTKQQEDVPEVEVQGNTTGTGLVQLQETIDIGGAGTTITAQIIVTTAAGDGRSIRSKMH